MSLEEWGGRDGEERPLQDLLDANSTLDIRRRSPGYQFRYSDASVGGSKKKELIEIWPIPIRGDSLTSGHFDITLIRTLCDGICPFELDPQPPGTSR